MDIEVLEDIRFFALEAFSANLVKARMNITRLRELINNPGTQVNRVGQSQNQLALAMKQYNAARIEMAKKKHQVLQRLTKKYPLLEDAFILAHLNAAITEYEVDEINMIANLESQSQSISNLGTAAITIPVYATPTRQDMAVLLVYFNACSYKKLAQNLLLTYHTLVRAGIPVFLVQHCFPGQVPLMPANGTTIFNTKSESYMFYKENLLNWLMRKVPQQYTKFYTMDCDLLFDKETWYDDVSILLDTHDIVQPFDTAFWLGSDLKTIELKRMGIVSAEKKGLNLKLSDHHPGFAWAFRRDFIEPKGIFDLNIMGSGDCIITSAALQKHIKYTHWNNNSPNWILEKYDEYFKSFEGNKTSFYSQSLYHLWHGSRDNRGYNKRYVDFKNIILERAITNIDELFILNDHGLYDFHHSVRDIMNRTILDYFQTRQEDGI
jgi:hypothetical protein